MNLFSKDVDSFDHPAVRELKRILEEIANNYRCSLTDVTIEHGVVTFQFDNDEVTYDILEALKDITGVQAVAYAGKKTSYKRIKEVLNRSRANE